MKDNLEISTLQQQILDDCMQYLFEHEDPQVVIKNYPQHRDSVYDAFGLTEEEQREMLMMVLENYGLSVPELADFGTICVATHKYELQLLAVQMLKKHRPRMDRHCYEQVKLWLEDGLENIAIVDLLATKITPVFLELGIASVDDFQSWSSSESKWTRRVGILTMLYLKDKVSSDMLLEFAEPLLNDPEKIVQQAVGIYLMELWGFYSEAVEEFLALHKDDAAPLVIQHATQKMHWDKKKRYGKAALNRSPGGQKSYDNRQKPRGRTSKGRTQPQQRVTQQPKQQRNYKSNRPAPRAQPRFTPKPKPRPNVRVREADKAKYHAIPDWDSFDEK
ncbi:MAG TPA: DNA alkylation repair protein [Candidatus Cloacimonadota bacterium]|nr:DNA alkylation repair protein [Candidatus Cloacimonadota bacterium]